MPADESAYPLFGFDEIAEENEYTTTQACAYLNISCPTYLKYIAEGRIKAIKAGRGWRTLKTELDRFLLSARRLAPTSQ